MSTDFTRELTRAEVDNIELDLYRAQRSVMAAEEFVKKYKDDLVRMLKAAIDAVAEVDEKLVEAEAEAEEAIANENILVAKKLRELAAQQSLKRSDLISYASELDGSD